jgi:hypothetical protein
MHFGGGAVTDRNRPRYADISVWAAVLSGFVTLAYCKCTDAPHPWWASLGVAVAAGAISAFFVLPFIIGDNG